MFYKIGFWVLLAIVIACGAMFMRSNPMKTTGAMSWIDIYSENPTQTLTFLKDNFDITVSEVSQIPGMGDYSIIKTHGQMWPFAGVMKTPNVQGPAKVMPHSMIYLTVKNYDAASARAVASGAKIIMDKMVVENMIFGVYEIPGGLNIGIVEYAK